MMTVTVTRKNRGKIAEMIRASIKPHAGKIERGCLAAGEFLLSESNKQVPVDTGSLKESGRVRQEGTGFTVCIYVGYGALDFKTTGRASRHEPGLVDREPYHYAVYTHFNAFGAGKDNGRPDYLGGPARGMRADIAAAFRAGMTK